MAEPPEQRVAADERTSTGAEEEDQDASRTGGNAAGPEQPAEEPAVPSRRNEVLQWSIEFLARARPNELWGAYVVENFKHEGAKSLERSSLWKLLGGRD